jgi:hypothetical protein
MPDTHTQAQWLLLLRTSTGRKCVEPTGSVLVTSSASVCWSPPVTLWLLPHGCAQPTGSQLSRNSRNHLARSVSSWQGEGLAERTTLYAFPGPYMMLCDIGCMSKFYISFRSCDMGCMSIVYIGFLSSSLSFLTE